MVTGHSLGGAIALVVGALTDRLAVAIQPPGVFYSLAKHEAAQRSHGELHQRSVSLVFEGDWIGRPGLEPPFKRRSGFEGEKGEGTSNLDLYDTI